MSESAAQAAFDATLAMEASTALPALQAGFGRFAATLGYDRVVVFAASMAQEDLLERIYWIHGDWFGTGTQVDAETYVRHCPVTRHVVRASMPFFWTKTQAPTGERYRVVRVPRGPGVHGLQIPVFGPLGLEGALSLGGARIDASAQARLSLAMVGTAAFRTARRLLEAPEAAAPSSLSAREREILSWTAAGRRQADIAATLGLSARKVEHHLRRIRKRLGASTTAQAIRIALRHGDLEGPEP